MKQIKCIQEIHISRVISKEVALKGTKLKNLKKDGTSKLNIGGQANDLWCNGSEVLFIKRMIKQSADFKRQVDWFTTLVSKKNI